MSITIRYADPTATGDTGATGATGAAGTDGATGPQGPAGPAGADGASYVPLPPNDLSAGAGTVLIDLTVSRQWRINLTGNITVDFDTTTMNDGDKFQIAFTQDATGGRTATFTPTIRWSRGTAPTWSGANKRDVLGFEYYQADSSFDGFIIGGDI